MAPLIDRISFTELNYITWILEEKYFYSEETYKYNLSQMIKVKITSHVDSR